MIPTTRYQKVNNMHYEDTGQYYKGIPLTAWVDPSLIAILNDDELTELHALMYSAVLDEVEGYVCKSNFIEANIVIQHVKDNLGKI